MPARQWPLYRTRPDMEHRLYVLEERRHRHEVQALGREALRREREGYHHTLDAAKAEAHQYQAILARAKRDGLKLLQVLEWMEKKAA